MQRHHFDRHARTIIKSISAGDPNDAFSSDDVALIMRVSLQWVTLARTKGRAGLKNLNKTISGVSA
jgi:hypothetical protein